MPACYPIPPVSAAAPPAPASLHASPEPNAGPSLWAPLLLTGGGVAALGMVCVVGLVVLIGLAAALEGDSAGGGVAASRGGTFEDNASRFMAEQGGSYTAPSVNYGD